MPPSEMQAFVSQPAAALPELQTLPVPRPALDEVLVRVFAAAINNADLVAGDTSRVAGYEFAGEVVSVGPGADPELRGRTVMGITDGAFAQLTTAHHRHVVPLPHSLDPVAAASLPTALTTEYGALKRAGLQAGGSVLVTAATSAIAAVGVQVAHVLGAATVIGTTRRPDRRSFLVERSGVDHVVVTGDDDLARLVTELTGGEGVDTALDHVAGGMLDQVIRAARVGGAVVSVGRLAGPVAEIDLFALARRAVVLQSVSYGLTPPSVLGDLFDGVTREVLPAVVDGRLRPLVDRTFDLADLHAAFEHAGTDAREGKVVLTVG